MMHKKRLIAAAAVTALAVAGCSGGGSGDDNKPGTGTVQLGLGEPASVIPPNTTESEGGTIVDAVYTGLVAYDQNSKPENVIAESIEPNKELDVWTIKLKDGFKFENGEAVDAEAFVRSWNWGAYGPNAASGSYFYDRIKGFDDVSDAEKPKEKELSGLKVVDDLTFEVSLNAPWIGFGQVLGYSAYKPMAKECVEDIEKCNEHPIGNGPFKFDGDWKHEESITLVRNDDYAGELPDVDRVEFTIYMGEDTCWADFQAGDQDICSPPVQEWEAARNDPDLKERLIQQDGTTFTYLGFPVFLDEYKDKKVRQAFNLAINREEVINVALPGRAKPAMGFTPKTIPGGTEDTCKFCEFDADKAKDLLEESDWPKDKKIEIWYNSDPTNKAIFEAVGNQIKENLGVDFELKEQEWADFLEILDENKQTGPFRLGWIPDYPLNENYLKPIYGNGPDNNFGYHNEEFEAKLAEADVAPDIETAKEMYRDAEMILGEDMPIVPLSFNITSTFYSADLLPESVKIYPIGGLQVDQLQMAS
jgi:oligopeptide transport system substrate-binding protein